MNIEKEVLSAIQSGRTLVFLKKHDGYSEHKTLDEMKGREPEPLKECNGFCGINDLLEPSEEKQP